jgi:hypothetical protein
MSLPHLLFLGWFVAIRIFFPSVIRWIAHDTYITAVLSVGYPLFSTLLWIHARRHSQPHRNNIHSITNDNETAKTRRKVGNDKNLMASSDNLLRKRKSLSQNKTTSSDSSNVPPVYSRVNGELTQNGDTLTIHSHNVRASKEAVVYWLRYWHCVSGSSVEIVSDECARLTQSFLCLTW